MSKDVSGGAGGSRGGGTNAHRGAGQSGALRARGGTAGQQHDNSRRAKDDKVSKKKLFINKATRAIALLLFYA